MQSQVCKVLSFSSPLSESLRTVDVHDCSSAAPVHLYLSVSLSGVLVITNLIMPFNNTVKPCEVTLIFGYTKSTWCYTKSTTDWPKFCLVFFFLIKPFSLINDLILCIDLIQKSTVKVKSKYLGLCLICRCD